MDKKNELDNEHYTYKKTINFFPVHWRTHGTYKEIIIILNIKYIIKILMNFFFGNISYVY